MQQLALASLLSSTMLSVQIECSLGTASLSSASPVGSAREFPLIDKRHYVVDVGEPPCPLDTAKPSISTLIYTL